MTSRASSKSKHSDQRQFKHGSKVLIEGSAASLNNDSPLTAIVAQIRANPALGIQVAKDVGIITSTGKLKKSYR